MSEEAKARELLEFLRDKWGKYDDAGKFEDWLFSDKAIRAITKVAAMGREDASSLQERLAYHQREAQQLMREIVGNPAEGVVIGPDKDGYLDFSPSSRKQQP